LRDFYRCATVVFVGKSLTAKGGQNPIEPAALGKPIIFGPNMQNFSAIARAFVENNAAIQVSNIDELEKTVDTLLGNAEQRAQLGENAIKVIQKNSGAVERTVEMIVKLVK
jgi:3-deoxy-D-manno-octulosonic-acid transferase